MQEFTTVYDITKEGYAQVMWFPVLWTLGATGFFLLLFFQAWYSEQKSVKLKEICGLCLALLVVTFGVFLTLNAYFMQNECINWAKNRGFDVIQGKLIYTYKSTKHDEFTVSGINFSVSRSDGTKCGYKSQGISNGRFVRISHREGCILKLEVVQD